MDVNDTKLGNPEEMLDSWAEPQQKAGKLPRLGKGFPWLAFGIVLAIAFGAGVYMSMPAIAPILAMIPTPVPVPPAGINATLVECAEKAIIVNIENYQNYTLNSTVFFIEAESGVLIYSDPVSVPVNGSAQVRFDDSKALFALFYNNGEYPIYAEGNLQTKAKCVR